MRIVSVGRQKHTIIICNDEPGNGNACHAYVVCERWKDPINENEKPSELTSVKFQNGPIKENGVNGCQNEDLIAIVIDRLMGFQSGEFACRENAIALTKLEEGLMWLRKRTQDREDRGVEGTSTK